jgi:hypothetical protein
MDEITEYKELLREWECFLVLLAIGFVGTALILCTNIILPVYYQLNALMTAIIFMGIFWAMMVVAMRRCNELRNHIYVLEHGEDQE